jgi:[acyl-carrier-protein] S-malonyltransferase
MPGCAVLTNATGGVCRDPHSLATALAAQIGQTVQWASCMSGVAERRPACVVEVGGGQALARMWSARYPDIPARSLDEFRSAEGAAAWISRQQVD